MRSSVFRHLAEALAGYLAFEVPNTYMVRHWSAFGPPEWIPAIGNSAKGTLLVVSTMGLVALLVGLSTRRWPQTLVAYMVGVTLAVWIAVYRTQSTIWPIGAMITTLLMGGTTLIGGGLGVLLRWVLIDRRP